MMPVQHSHHVPRREPPTYRRPTPVHTLTIPSTNLLSHNTHNGNNGNKVSMQELFGLLFVILVLVGMAAWTLTVKCSRFVMGRRNSGRPRSRTSMQEAGEYTGNFPKAFNKVGSKVEGGARNVTGEQKRIASQERPVSSEKRTSMRGPVMAQATEDSALLGPFQGRPYHGSRYVRGFDGTSESISVKHRDDCDGHCGTQSKRRSFDY